MRESLVFAKNFFGRRIVTAVEIGVANGKNSFNIRTTLRLNKLYLIDLWSPQYSPQVYDWAVEVFKKFDDDQKVTIIRGEAIESSSLFKDGSVDYLYLDDCHNPDHVEKEIKAWFPKMACNSIIAGHDYVEGNKRAELAVKKLFKKFQHKQNTGEEVSDWWVVKDETCGRDI